MDASIENLFLYETDLPLLTRHNSVTLAFDVLTPKIAQINLDIIEINIVTKFDPVGWLTSCLKCCRTQYALCFGGRVDTIYEKKKEFYFRYFVSIPTELPGNERPDAEPRFQFSLSTATAATKLQKQKYLNEMETINGSWNNESNITYFIPDYPVPVVPKWGFWAKLLSTPILVLIGLIGNVLSFMVMKTKTLRHESYSHYLCALAVFDTLTLIIRQVESVDEYLVSHRKTRGVFHHFNDSSCKVYNFTAHVIILMCSWLVVFMAVERVIAVCFPFKKVNFRKETGAAVAIGILFVLVCLSQSFRFLMIEHAIYDDKKNIWDCLAAQEYIGIYTSLDVYFFLWTLMFVLPVVCIVICNSFVLYYIFRVRKALRKEDNYLTYRNGRARERSHRSTYMLLIVTFMYIITLLPLFTLSLIVDVTIKVGSLETARSTYVALRPYIDISVSVSLLNYAANFFIYVLSGKRFRFELQNLFIRKGWSKEILLQEVRGKNISDLVGNL